MFKIDFSKLLKDAKKSIIKHSPEILTGLGIAGMATAVIFAVEATPKAEKLIDEKKEELGLNENTTIKPIDKVKIAWKCYIPTVATFGLSSACLIFGNSVNSKRNAALATAYTLSETALKEYQEKVVETIGEKKEQLVRDSIAKDKIEQNPVVNNEIIITESGNTLCYDSISGRYFKSDIDKLKKAAIDLSIRMLDEMYVSLNDFYYEIGLRETKLGDEIGWHVENGRIDLGFSSQLATDGTPCLVLDYNVAPRYDFK